MTARILPTALLVLALGACGDEPVTDADAQQALTDIGRPADATFEQGSFDFSKPIEVQAPPRGGRLASTSWDIYYVLDDGDVGAWGAGMDVFSSAEKAQSSADRLATFWVCDGPRQPVELDDDGYDLLEASTCKRPTEQGYYATLSAADGIVTANLTLASHDRDVAAAALVAVWASMSDSTEQVVDDLG